MESLPHTQAEAIGLSQIRSVYTLLTVWIVSASFYSSYVWNTSQREIFQEIQWLEDLPKGGKAKPNQNKMSVFETPASVHFPVCWLLC